ncbi:SDR family NAD(P)-dependent oxidoreductase [Paraburkholderia sediminicola]|uniref:SDR family NAD(P)-dependent oxidoreductase n=1 Tax=Paraburkholderia sediminicola TaxID=458836 RepID=UPI0038BD5C59
MDSTSPRLVLVTGCDTGIGRKLAESFRRARLDVYRTGLNPPRMGDLAKQGIRTLRLDVTNLREVSELQQAITQQGLRVNILVTVSAR